jgi:hypothetical protein
MSFDLTNACMVSSSTTYSNLAGVVITDKILFTIDSLA